MIYAGIDNGLEGGVAFIGSCGSFIEAFPMPTIEIKYDWSVTKKRKRKGVITTETKRDTDRIIDAYELYARIALATQGQQFTLAIEACPKHADRASTMRSMGMSYGILIATASLMSRANKLVVVRSGNPMDSWQRKMLGDVAQGQTKSAALAKAREIWPDEAFLPSAKSKKPHDGMIDSALIAEFARRKAMKA